MQPPRWVTVCVMALIFSVVACSTTKDREVLEGHCVEGVKFVASATTLNVDKRTISTKVKCTQPTEAQHMNIKHVQQKCGSSCGIACVAMTSGIDFDTVLEWSGRPGISARKLYDLACKADLAPSYREHRELSPDAVHIVAVPSLNIKAGMHLIVIDTRDANLAAGEWCKMYDPVEGIPGKEVYTPELLRGWGDVLEVKV